MKLNGKLDEPSNIKWENLDVGGVERVMRKCCMGLVLLAVMLFTFAIIIVANLVKVSKI